jgi:glycosyltransferase involved in cell wall biosynthesis
MTEFSDTPGPGSAGLLESPALGWGIADDARSDGPDRQAGRPGHRRVLVVAYQFPPVGGAGVQRVTKFVKHLPKFGWQADVLTVKNPSVPLIDESLLADIPPESLVARATTWEPGYAVKSLVAGNGNPAQHAHTSAMRARIKRALRSLANVVLQPDPQILWVPHAIRMGRDLLRRQQYSAILASGPPFSTFLVGRALTRSSRVPLVVDYRDEWDLANQYMENRKFGRIGGWVQRRQQNGVLRAASAVIATTQASTASLERAVLCSGSTARTACIYNGFDPDDFPASAPANSPPASGAPLKLVYVGTLWNLTSMAPLGQALRLLAQRVPDLKRRIQLVIAGRRTTEEQQHLDDLQAATGCVEQLAYLDHPAAIALMHSADMLLVNLAGHAGVERVLPAKVFEYFAVRRPILGITPRGELWDLLKQRRSAHVFEPGATPEIAEFLEAALAAGGAPGQSAISHDPLDGFDRVSQCRQLVDLLETVASTAAKSAGGPR